MNELLNGLNSAQRIAVTSPASVLQVLAPPGSGKTKTLTARVAHLILHDGYDPGTIIVCTFTIKAAREMGERLEHLLGKDVAKKLILGTFHSVSRRFLSVFGEHVGLDKDFGIADTSDSASIIKRIVANERLSIDPQAARSRISKLKAQGISPEANHAQTATKKKNAAADMDIHELTTVYALYEENLRLNHLLDFDDLLLKCRDLLRRHPPSVAYIKAVLIDEFQDTNHVQFDLMTYFAQSCKKISTVGDPDQSIYGWRSADVTNLRRMKEHYPELHTVNLEENYRSSGLILFAAQEVIEQDSSRPQKSLMPTHGPGTTPVFRTLKSAWREAEWITMELKRIKTLSAGLLKWDDYAILVRSSSLSRVIEQALNSQQIPYRMVGGARFFDRAEVRLVLDYLRVISNPAHTDALIRILNVPRRGIGDATLRSLTGEATRRKMPLWDLVLEIGQHLKPRKDEIRGSAMNGIRLFINIILKCRGRLQRLDAKDQGLTSFMQSIIASIDVQAHLRREYKEEADVRWANVEELVALAAEAENKEPEEELHNIGQSEKQRGEGEEADLATEDHDPDVVYGSEDRNPPSATYLAERLAQFLSTVALSTDAKAIEQGEQREEGQVVISTMHAAKGLEWPIVFIPGVYNGVMPHSRNEDADEERRLLYVAMTRAQAMLYMSRPDKDSVQKQATSPCPFLTESTGGSAQYATKGPKLTMQVVQEMAAILRRRCPTAANVLQAKKTMGMEGCDDNIIPEDPNEDYDKEQDAYRFKDGYPRKRSLLEPGRPEQETQNMPVFQAASGLQRYPCSTEAMTTAPASLTASAAASSSFSSAARLPQLERSGSSISDTASDQSRGKQTAKRARVEAGQRCMTSFFTTQARQQAQPQPRPDIASREASKQPLQALPSVQNAVARASIPNQPMPQKPKLSNPASKGRGISSMTGQNGTLGVQPARPGFKRHVNAPGLFSKARD